MDTTALSEPSVSVMSSLSAFQLTVQQIQEFYEVGFLVVPQVFSRSEIQEMREACDRLLDIAETLQGIAEVRGSLFVVETLSHPALQPQISPSLVPSDGASGASLSFCRTPQHVRIHRIQWVGAAEPVFRRYGEDVRILQLASDILGATQMNHLVNQIHFKFPHDGIEFPWHQDSQYRRFGTDLWKDVNGKGSFVQIATAIDDMTPDNGPLQFIPYSCQQGHLGLDKLSNLEQELLNRSTNSGVQESYNPSTRLNMVYQVNEDGLRLFDPSRAVSMQMKAGDVVLFGPYTIHRSLPNESEHPRRIFINGYAYPGANTRVYEGDGAGRLLVVPGLCATTTGDT